MMTKKKTILNIAFLLLVLGLTIYFVFRGEDLDNLVHWLGQADWRYWVGSVVCVVIFIIGESFIIHYHRDDGDYKTWTLWLWATGKEGTKEKRNHHERD